ncbi:MAG: amino acid transporter, partial [Actinomycetota bacterium]
MAIDARGPWLALEPAAATPLFLALDASWWVTGGCAIDLFLRRERPHHDLDIAVLRREQDAVRSHLAAWDLNAFHDGVLTPWPPGTR